MTETDARTFPDGTPLAADVCIVGAGAAGITVARELVGLDVGVLLLESGGIEPDASVQDLNEGTVVGDAYTGLRATRHRGAGGAIHLWNTPVLGRPGGKYAPLDPVDFEERPAQPCSGWPFDRRHLEPFYRRAQIACGVGPFAYDAEDWSAGGRPPLALAGDRVTTRVYQFGTASAFTLRNLTALRDADNIRLCHHATVCALEADGAGRRFTGARAVDASGRPLHVRAGTFVLAAGAIENARLLLLSGGAPAPRNRHGWVGRCFMEHPRDYALTLFPHSPELFRQAAFYDRHPAADGTIIGGRLALTDRAIRTDGLPNASVTLLPRTPAPSGWARALDALRGLARPRPSIGYGWSEVRDPGRSFDAFRLIVNLEQRPDPENRVVLATGRDRLGVPRVALHWRWRDEEQAGLERLRTAIARSLDGLGRVEIRSERRPDPNAHHHAGTTRMHRDPRRGVVDADGRVHGTDNLYVTGASTFPTAGFANPTLTIVALALRLADHLARSRPW